MSESFALSLLVAVLGGAVSGTILNVGRVPFNWYVMGALFVMALTGRIVGDVQNVGS